MKDRIFPWKSTILILYSILILFLIVWILNNRNKVEDTYANLLFKKDKEDIQAESKNIGISKNNMIEVENLEITQKPLDDFMLINIKWYSNLDTVFYKSYDNGTTWSSPQVINYEIRQINQRELAGTKVLYKLTTIDEDKKESEGILKNITVENNLVADNNISTEDGFEKINDNEITENNEAIYNISSINGYYILKSNKLLVTIEWKKNDKNIEKQTLYKSVNNNEEWIKITELEKDLNNFSYNEEGGKKIKYKITNTIMGKETQGKILFLDLPFISSQLPKENNILISKNIDRLPDTGFNEKSIFLFSIIFSIATRVITKSIV